MSSILTNASAMTALQTLNQTNKDLATTQNRISTGLRVSEASDNAAYWSISTTMKSDNKAMSTVQDALGLGSATVDVAYTAMESTKDALDEIKTKLVAAKQPGVDKSKIQSEISQLQNQIEGIASAASFSGSNWLQVDSSSSDYSGIEKVVSSFSRGSDGSLSIGTIDVDITKSALFDSATDGNGLLEAGSGGIRNGSATDTAAASAAALDFEFSSVTLGDSDAISFDIALDGGGATTVTIDKSTVDTALTTTDGVIGTAGDMSSVLNQAFTDAGIDAQVGATATGDTISVASAQTDATSAVEITNTSESYFGVADIDITAADADLDSYIAGIDTMAESVTSAASDLGAVKSRIDLQKDFVSSIMDAVDRGVGQLVDADMNDESTKLKALQTQQQLGIQALSIANSSSQNILSLFR